MHADLDWSQKVMGTKFYTVKLVKESLQIELSQPDPWVKISEKAADSFCVLSRLRNAINDLKVM